MRFLSTGVEVMKILNQEFTGKAITRMPAAPVTRCGQQG
jgi:hypothetical protein